MSFEVRDQDLLGRIGRLETKSGVVETPLFLPVVNPAMQMVAPRRMYHHFGCEGLITNAYILRKEFPNQVVREGLHGFLDFNGMIMTDSGAYQLLVYGDIEITPQEVVEFQEEIGSDVATILDIPTGWKVSREHAEETVEATVRRGRELFTLKGREDVLWVGPVQGGGYLDLVARSSWKMGGMPFQVHALGSPTKIMQNYRFDILADMVLTAKTHLPIQRPLHLFGAGHPMMFSLAVALGCDLFDSAAYALYARKGRYLTEQGTFRLNELEYFPCSCPHCTKYTPQEVRDMPKEERETFLGEHNLYACQAEMRRIKQAIREGRMWEHLRQRCQVHPALLQALKKLENYREYMEEHSPAIKRGGIFFFDRWDLARPEVVRYNKRLKERYTPPEEAEILLLLPQTPTKPFSNSPQFTEIMKVLPLTWEDKIHICFYVTPFGVVPRELDEVFPLCQYETTFPPDHETLGFIVERVQRYLEETSYRMVILVNDPENWDQTILEAAEEVCKRKGIPFRSVSLEDEEQGLNLLEQMLSDGL
ncbi:MAG: tRNA guanosine(15) transglycosylase TgtA [Thermoproteota archaeon]